MENKDYEYYIKNVLTTHNKNKIKGYGIKSLIICIYVAIIHIMFPFVEAKHDDSSIIYILCLTSLVSLFIYLSMIFILSLIYLMFENSYNNLGNYNIILFNYPFVKKMTNNKFNFIKNDVKSNTIYIPTHNDYIEYKYNPIDFINSYSSIIQPLISKAVEDYDKYMNDKKNDDKLKKELCDL